MFNGEDFGDSTLLAFGFWLPAGQEKMLVHLHYEVSAKEVVAYRMDGNEVRPWIRVYEGVFPNENVGKVTAKVDELMQVMGPMPLFWGEMEESEEAVILWGKKAEVIRLFQEALLAGVNDFREGYKKVKYDGKWWEPHEESSIAKWGWPWVAEYEPYVVVARAKERFELRDFDLEWEEKRAELTTFFVAEKLGAGRLKVINEYQLHLSE